MDIRNIVINILVFPVRFPLWLFAVMGEAAGDILDQLDELLWKLEKKWMD